MLGFSTYATIINSHVDSSVFDFYGSSSNPVFYIEDKEQNSGFNSKKRKYSGQHGLRTRLYVTFLSSLSHVGPVFLAQLAHLAEPVSSLKKEDNDTNLLGLLCADKMSHYTDDTGQPCPERQLTDNP